MRKFVYLMAVVLGFTGILVIGLFIRYRNQAMQLDAGTDNLKTYRKHYLFVSSDESQMKDPASGWSGAARIPLASIPLPSASTCPSP